jgi:hypothetical protein
VTGVARCPDCGRETPAEASSFGLCPFCLLQLGLEADPPSASPWIDPEHASYQVLGVLRAWRGATSYLAEQEAPTRRFVVLTPLDVSLGNPEDRARIEAALLALVAFRHALVERVFGGLVSGSGATYLVTEHVPGTPLERYCEEARADLRRRAALCRSAAGAIRAAHEHGIVHGALTEESVIVTARRGEPDPVVTGFGSTLRAGGAVPTASSDVEALAAVARLLGLPVPEGLARTAAALVDALGVLTA